MVDLIVFECITIPLAIFFTALGIFAWSRKKPMWFWSGSEVKSEDITDVAAYNRANGIMWIIFSLIFWSAAVLAFFKVSTAGLVIGAGTICAIPVLVIAYSKIIKKYRAKK